MSVRWKWIISFGLLVSLIGLQLLISKKQLNSDAESSPSQNQPNSSNPMVQSLSGVHIVENNGPKQVWELWASKGVLDSQNTWKVQDLKVHFFADNGMVYEVTAPEGVVESDKKNDVLKLKLYKEVITKSSSDYTDYSIMVYLLGTTEKPIVKIESDPPLSQDEVISVLLYGRTLEELDTDQQESVGNTKSALTDRSLGIASLYLLASTPIESVGYNPDTQEVSAKVKLAKGTSLNLGSSSASGASSNRVGIRRRLSKHFTISTDYTRETGTDAAGSESATSTVETLIEWSKRY